MEFQSNYDPFVNNIKCSVLMGGYDKMHYINVRNFQRINKKYLKISASSQFEDQMIDIIKMGITTGQIYRSNFEQFGIWILALSIIDQEKHQILLEYHSETFPHISKQSKRGGSDGSAVKSVCCSCGKPEFGSSSHLSELEASNSIFRDPSAQLLKFMCTHTHGHIHRDT